VFSAKAQIDITKNDTIALKSDSLVLRLDKPRGAITWQFSKNAVQWIDVKNITADSLLISKIDSSGFYRAKIADGNCNPIFSDSVTVQAYQLYGKLILPIQQGKGSVVIQSLIDEVQPTLKGEFSIKTNSVIMAFDTLIGKPVYFGFPGTEEKIKYQLNAKETALYFCMSALPFMLRPNYSNSIQKIKDALYNYPEVKTLESKINEIISSDGYLDIDKIGTELGNALDAIVLSFNINYEQKNLYSESFKNVYVKVTESPSLKI
jgi:hypothetical protein